MTDPNEPNPNEPNPVDPDHDADIEAAIRGLDAPRPLGAAGAAGLRSAIAASAQPAGTAAASAPTRGPRRAMIGLGAAAAAVIVLALVALALPSSEPADTVASATTTSTSPEDSGLPAIDFGVPESTTTTGGGGVVPVGDGTAVRADLTPAASCSSLLAWFRSNAEADVGPWGLDEPVRIAVAQGDPEAADGGPSALSATDAPATIGGTNVQEAGIGEPDHAKVGDGIAVYARPDGGTEIIALGDEPSVAATLDLGRGRPRFFLDGPTLVSMVPDHRNGGTIVRVHDLTDPTSPELRSERLTPGYVLDARRLGSDVHLVWSASRQPEWAYPDDGTSEAKQRAEAENRRRARESSIDDWIPGDIDCTSVSTPPERAGYRLLVVESFSTDAPDSVRRTSVVGDWTQGVYASSAGLVIGTVRWERDEPGIRTAVHRFAWDGPGVSYTGSGWVAGLVGDPWRYSEHDEVLRVVSDGTDDGVRLSLLDATSPVLAEIGSLVGFPAGHSAYAVRYFGDIGFVVTYERRDPLHVIDLSDPTDPRFRGVLETPGFAEYLHPVADGILLGVGVDDNGNPQAVTYDVRDLDAPTRPSVAPLDGRSVAALHDHHAFTWVAERSTAVLPGLISHDRPASAALVSVSGLAVAVEGEITHPYEDEGKGEVGPGEQEPCEPPPEDPEPLLPVFDDDEPPEECPEPEPQPRPEPDWVAYHAAGVDRSLLVGDAVLTFSDSGMAVTDIADWSQRSFVEFPETTTAS